MKIFWLILFATYPYLVIPAHYGAFGLKAKKAIPVFACLIVGTFIFLFVFISAALVVEYFVAL